MSFDSEEEGFVFDTVSSEAVSQASIVAEGSHFADGVV